MIAGLFVSLVYADSIDLFSDAFGPRGAKLQRQTDEQCRKKSANSTLSLFIQTDTIDS